MYVWQMNDGRWHVSAATNSPRDVAEATTCIPGFETRAEAQAAMDEAMSRVKAARANEEISR